MSACVPITSYAMPTRGPITRFGHTYDVSAIPSPARRMPFVMLPEFGMIVPMAACVFAAPGAIRIWPVTGCIAFFVLPEQTTPPLLQPAT